ncbi:hypothetical protein NLJ89_g3739 [Agrocybe chaxingu]|uniref:DUF6535 domain-containing protein n=1 Tax=Agrocybe chaxingu TaxID=84603 RepID=A0A9W8MYD4_9AGAR|nr:hypothetical protein NLJ89_g3739 [Agrocybe chaxingu]
MTKEYEQTQGSLSPEGPTAVLEELGAEQVEKSAAEKPMTTPEFKCGTPYTESLQKEEGHDYWKALLEPLQDNDTAQCKIWEGEVQNILIFASLFSAVVTAFVIESYKDLKPDPTYTTVVLLAQIANRLDANVNVASKLGKSIAQSIGLRIHALARKVTLIVAGIFSPFRSYLSTMARDRLGLTRSLFPFHHLKYISKKSFDHDILHAGSWVDLDTQWVSLRRDYSYQALTGLNRTPLDGTFQKGFSYGPVFDQLLGIQRLCRQHQTYETILRPAYHCFVECISAEGTLPGEFAFDNEELKWSGEQYYRALVEMLRPENTAVVSDTLPQPPAELVSTSEVNGGTMEKAAAALTDRLNRHGPSGSEKPAAAWAIVKAYMLIYSDNQVPIPPDLLILAARFKDLADDVVNYPRTHYSKGVLDIASILWGQPEVDVLAELRDYPRQWQSGLSSLLVPELVVQEDEGEFPPATPVFDIFPNPEEGHSSGSLDDVEELLCEIEGRSEEGSYSGKDEYSRAEGGVGALESTVGRKP